MLLELFPGQSCQELRGGVTGALLMSVWYPWATGLFQPEITVRYLQSQQQGECLWLLVGPGHWVSHVSKFNPLPRTFPIPGHVPAGKGSGIKELMEVKPASLILILE